MASLISEKDLRDCTSFVLSLAKAMLIIPAGVISSFGLLLGLLATLAGLSPVEVVLSFIIEAVGPWLITTVSFLTIPYFLAAVLSPTVGTPERRKKTFELWPSQNIAFTVITPASAILSSLLAYAKLVKVKSAFVAGEAPQLE